MSKKHTKSRIHIPIYGRTLLVNITKNVKKEVRLIDKDAFEGQEVEAVVVEDKNGCINLIIHPRADINTICHESFHITSGVLEDAGLELGGNSEEAYAYLIGWVAEKVSKKLKNYNKK